MSSLCVDLTSPSLGTGDAAATGPVDGVAGRCWAIAVPGSIDMTTTTAERTGQTERQFGIGFLELKVCESSNQTTNDGPRWLTACVGEISGMTPLSGAFPVSGI